MAPTSAGCQRLHPRPGQPITIRCLRRTVGSEVSDLGIDEVKTVPDVPLSRPFMERLVGTTRRGFLDHVLFWNARDLERKLADFEVYYNTARSHASFGGPTPLTFAMDTLSPVRS